jgi:methylmalonyl-CoA mutase cobalamin-binding subunit
MGFDRIYPPGTTVERALEDLRADLYKEHKAAV